MAHLLLLLFISLPDWKNLFRFWQLALKSKMLIPKSGHILWTLYSTYACPRKVLLSREKHFSSHIRQKENTHFQCWFWGHALAIFSTILDWFITYWTETTSRHDTIFLKENKWENEFSASRNLFFFSKNVYKIFEGSSLWLLVKIFLVRLGPHHQPFEIPLVTDFLPKPFFSRRKRKKNVWEKC